MLQKDMKYGAEKIEIVQKNHKHNAEKNDKYASEKYERLCRKKKIWCRKRNKNGVNS